LEFWSDREVLSIEEPGSIRILVYSNTGVGKSSLINEFFSVKVVSPLPTAQILVLGLTFTTRQKGLAENEERTINEPFTTDGRPELIIHLWRP
jgi:ribosome biogenesis GTPase A